MIYELWRQVLWSLLWTKPVFNRSMLIIHILSREVTKQITLKGYKYMWVCVYAQVHWYSAMREVLRRKQRIPLLQGSISVLLQTLYYFIMCIQIYVCTSGLCIAFPWLQKHQGYTQCCENWKTQEEKSKRKYFIFHIDPWNIKSLHKQRHPNYINIC